MKLVFKNPLFFAFLLPAVADATVTLLGQNQAYWLVNSVNEASPAYWALAFSPWLFVFGSIIWFMVWYWVMKRISEPFNLFMMFLFIAGHSWGSTSWFWRMAKDYGLYISTKQISVILVWLGVLGYFVSIAAWATKCLKCYLDKR